MKTLIITPNSALSRKTARGSTFVMLFWAIISAVVLNVSAKAEKEPQTGSHEPMRVKVWAVKPETDRDKFANR
jgi:hypothetical protein